MSEKARFLALGLAVLLASCGTKQVDRSQAGTIEGYALVFENRPIAVYPDNMPARPTIINTDQEMLPNMLRRAYDGKLSGTCVAYLFRLSVTVDGKSLGSTGWADVKSIGAVRATTVAERDAFIARANSPVLDSKSVCATTM